MLKNAQVKHAPGVSKYGGQWLIHDLFGLNQDGLIIVVQDGLITAVCGNNNVEVHDLSFNF